MTQEEHPTLSVEQINMIAEHTERAARKALRRYVRRSVTAFGILLAAIIGVRYLDTSDSAASRAAIIQSGDAVSVSGCNRDFETIKILRDEIKRGKALTQKYVEEGTITQAQADRAIKQTNKLLSRYKLPDCRQALEILTDDPHSALVPVQEPKYPGYARDKASHADS